jgi:quercetin dioxygenase-like cupin family protein
VAAGEALVAPAGVEHGLVNDGTNPLLVLVVVTPPPPHAQGAAKP